MQFKTTIPPLSHQGLVSYQSKITMLGSCFTENIGERLQKHQFNTLVNPFGIVFNPLSLVKQLNGKVVNETHFLEDRGRVLTLDCHSKYHATTKTDLVAKMTTDTKDLAQRLAETDVLILTFGTAWVYQFNETNEVIANCQKLPSKAFTKKQLKIIDLKTDYLDSFNQLIQVNPNIKIVLTVSPVRHIKDGFIDNSRSKASLLNFCAALEDSFPNHVIYLPSYELVMDDLRDYRFYEKDLIHPNELAVDYIFEYFQQTFMSDQTKKTMALVHKYNQLNGHIDLLSTETEKEARGVKLQEMLSQINKAKLS